MGEGDERRYDALPGKMQTKKDRWKFLMRSPTFTAGKRHSTDASFVL